MIKLRFVCTAEITNHTDRRRREREGDDLVCGHPFKMFTLDGPRCGLHAPHHIERARRRSLGRRKNAAA